MIMDHKFTKCPFCGSILVVSESEKRYMYKGREVVLIKHDSCSSSKYFLAEPVNHIAINSLRNHSRDFADKYLDEIFEIFIHNLDIFNKPKAESMNMQNKIYEEMRSKYTTDDGQWIKQHYIVDNIWFYLRAETFFVEKMKPIKLMYLKSK